jgi:hypothetical protein
MLPPELVEKIDDMMKADLLQWRGLWFGCLLATTAFVVVGLALEGGELWYEMRSIARSKFRLFRYQTVVLEHRVEWAKVVAFVGWILIVVGVAGEMFAEVMISDADRNIEAFNTATLADERRETALALARAAEAELTASGFDLLIAEARKDAAESKKDAESERLARVRLQEDIAPRRLTSDERKKLSEATAQSAGIVALIQYGGNDTEANAFGVDIATALSLAHWRPTDPMEVLEMREGPLKFGTSPQAPTGVDIEACPNEASRKAAKSVHDGLTGLGFSTSIERDNCKWVQMLGPQNKSLTDPAGIFIKIRPRPEGPQGAAKLRHDMAHNNSSANQ